MKKPQIRMAEPNCGKCLEKDRCGAYKQGKFYIICQVTGGARTTEKPTDGQDDAFRK